MVKGVVMFWVSAILGLAMAAGPCAADGPAPLPFTPGEKLTFDLKWGSLGAGTATLSVWHHFQMESYYDGGVLEVSTDGTTWQDVEAAGGVFLEGGYNDTVSTGWDNPLGGRAAWSGDSGGLLQSVVDLSVFSDSQLWVRFRIGCDSRRLA